MAKKKTTQPNPDNEGTAGKKTDPKGIDALTPATDGKVNVQIEVEKYLRDKFDFRYNAATKKVECTDKNTDKWHTVNVGSIYFDLQRTHPEYKYTEAKIKNLLKSDFVSEKYTPQIPQDDEDVKIYFANNEIKCTEKGVYYMTSKNEIQICRKPLRFRYMLQSDDTEETKRILQIGNDNEDCDVIIISNEDASSLTRFKSKLNNKQVTFRGASYMLDAFMEVQHEQSTMENAVSVPVLGYNEEAESFFFSDAVCHNGQMLDIDEFGIVSINGKKYQMPYKKTKYFDPPQTEASKLYMYEENKDMTFEKWVSKIRVAYGDVSILPVCFGVMSVFRHVVFNNCGFVPIVYLQGMASTGKSRIGKLIGCWFGNPDEGINLKKKNTKEGISKIYSLVSGVSICTNEFKNEQWLIDLFQAFWDCTGDVKGTLEDYNIINRKTRSSAILTSNYCIYDEPFFSRLVYVQFREQKEDLDRKRKIVDEELVHNYSCILKELLQYNELISAEFKMYYDYLHAVISTNIRTSYDRVAPRYIDNIAALLTPLYILLDKGKIHLDGLDKDQLIMVGQNNLSFQLETIKSSGEVGEFWRVFSELNLYKGTHYKINEGCFSINWHSVFDIFAKENGIRNMYEKRMEKQRFEDLLRNSVEYMPYTNSKGVIEQFHKQRFCVGAGDAVDDNSSTNVKQGLDFDYSMLKQNFGVDFGDF